MSKKTISILICALNEEKNIGHLLADIMQQTLNEKIGTEFAIITVIVVSDGSSDSTAQIVQEAAKRDLRVVLIENEKRIGKILSIDKALKIISTDFVIFFDADVRLDRNTISNLLTPLLNHHYDLVGGNPVPYPPQSVLNIAEQASIFSWYLLQAIKKQQPLSIYSAHGRILCASKALYSNLDFTHLSTPGDDQYMYLKSGHNFFYEPTAVVHYKLNRAISDYLKQGVRFRRAQKIRAKNLSPEVVKKEFFVKHRLGLLITTLLQHPYRGFWWTFLYIWGALTYVWTRNQTLAIGEVWGEVRSTK